MSSIPAAQSIRGLLKPKDGTPPFWVNAGDSDAHSEYDSDDDYTTDLQALADFDLHTREQKLEPQRLPDNRFLIPSYRPVEENPHPHGPVVNCADTVISLCFQETHYILVRSYILINSHPFFRAGFSSRWSSNKLTKPVVIEECRILYRYELQYEPDGTTSLIGKTSATPRYERVLKDTDAQVAFKRHTEDAQVVRDMFDEHALRFSFGAWLKKDLNVLRGPWYRFICRAAHYLGFEMLCGYPPKTYSTTDDTEVFRGFRGPQYRNSEHGKMLIILKLVEWIHAYAPFNSLGPQVEHLMLSERFIGAVMEYPHTALRIAKLTQGEEIFRMALSQVILVFDDGYLGRDPEDDGELESDSEGDSTSEDWSEDDEKGLASSDHKANEDNDEIQAKAAGPRDEDVAKYDELEEQLGHDQELVSHVTRMYGIIYEEYRWDCGKAAEVRPELPKPAAASKSKLIWRFWIQYQSRIVFWAKAKTLGDIGLGKVKPETVLLRYQEANLDEEEMSNRMMRRVLMNLACMLDAAKVVLSDSVFTIDGYKDGPDWRDRGPKNKYWGWEISGQLDGYRYPWQPVEKKSGTALPNIMDMPNFEE